MDFKIDRLLSRKYNPRFGHIAVNRCFVSSRKVRLALLEQLSDELAGRPHRLIGRILLDNGWITGPQIEAVLTELFSRKRKKTGTTGLRPGCRLPVSGITCNSPPQQTL